MIKVNFTDFSNLYLAGFWLFGPAVWRHLSQFEERRMLCYSVLQSAVSVGNNVRKSTSVVIFFHEFFYSSDSYVSKVLKTELSVNKVPFFQKKK